MDTKPYPSNALHPNELGLGRIRVMQASASTSVRIRQGNNRNTARIDVSF